MTSLQYLLLALLCGQLRWSCSMRTVSDWTAQPETFVVGCLWLVGRGETLSCRQVEL